MWWVRGFMLTRRSPLRESRKFSKTSLSSNSLSSKGSACADLGLWLSESWGWLFALEEGFEDFDGFESFDGFDGFDCLGRGWMAWLAVSR